MILYAGEIISEYEYLRSILDGSRVVIQYKSQKKQELHQFKLTIVDFYKPPEDIEELIHQMSSINHPYIALHPFPSQFQTDYHPVLIVEKPYLDEEIVHNIEGIIAFRQRQEKFHLKQKNLIYSDVKHLLHDVVKNSLFGIKLLTSSTDVDPKFKEMTEEAIDYALSEVNKYMLNYQVVSNWDDFKYVTKRLKRLVEQCKRSINITLTDKLPFYANNQVLNMMYFFIKEVIFNWLQHSDHQHADLKFTLNQDQIIIQFTVPSTETYILHENSSLARLAKEIGGHLKLNCEKKSSHLVLSVPLACLKTSFTSGENKISVNKN